MKKTTTSLYDKYNWDLEDLLNGQTLESLYNSWIKIQEAQIKMVDNFYTTLDNFKKWTKLQEQDELISNRLSNYISNNLSENVSDEKFLAWDQKLTMKSHEFSKHFVGVSNAILENKNKIRKYLLDKNLKEYTRSYELLFKEEKHILSKKENETINKISINNGAVGNIFSTLQKDIKFDDAKDSKGKLHPLITQTDVTKNLKNADRTLRMNSWINFNKAFAGFESTLTQTLYYNYLKLNTYAKLHNYKNYIDRTCNNDEIDISLIESLYKYVELFKPTYLSFKKESSNKLKSKLKLKKLEPWDMSMDISKTKITFTIEQMKKTILEGLSILGTEYTSMLKKAMNEKWISFLPKKDKYTGAYSIGGTKGLNKYYILMNFDESYDSVSTLAHELGHSMNSYYYNLEQKVYSDTTIFTAEIPSILNETLLALYMIEKNKNNKVLVNNFIKEICDNFFNTTTRQIIFSNFEYEANNMVNESKPFTKEALIKLYQEMSIKYGGTKKKELKPPYIYGLSTIFRIPHFYAGNFYVYKYAVGQIVAICVANKIINKEKGILDKLFMFLKSGTSRSPLETIKLLGIDMTKKEPYEEAIDFIKSLVEKYKK
ncbi:MAG: oligoendopeptidase F [Mycoplasmoidaceae bacterium]|nr:MAG: oligoendopeptidase F [Mycoplasmoidaceae bacterium]